MDKIQQRRDFVFLLLSSVFLTCMVMLNVLGITRFMQVGWFQVAIGVLPYPITFLCTDLICEFYGRKRANQLVTVGFVANLLLFLIMYVASLFPSVQNGNLPPWQVLNLADPAFFPDGSTFAGKIELYDMLFATTSGAVAASMVAYLLAQLCDVRLFHFWKRLTSGKHLWLRNNGSTMISQLVDTAAVISVTFGTAIWTGKMEIDQAGTLFSCVTLKNTFK